MRKFLALVLALVMTMSLVTVSAGAATGFADDADITNAEAVEVLNAIGVLTGNNGKFNPAGKLTRGAGAKIVAYLMLGQSAADKLTATYTVFEDVTDSVGLAPYIEWAAANGIVGGYGNGKFGPYDTLTEYAFGKMLLTAIGYDAELQGYVGAGWQKSVYRDAIAKNIFTGAESAAACIREEAARMALATLETTYVVYGTTDINNNGSYVINGKVVTLGVDGKTSVTGAVNTTTSVWSTYGGRLTFDGAAEDVWGNPGDRWSYKGSVIGFYEDASVAEYTTQVDYCDLLVDLGIPANSPATAEILICYNGDKDIDDLYIMADEGVYFDDNDTPDDDSDDTDYADADELGHAATHYTCDEAFVGGQ
ncbi:MAG: S-layer homology domain-containing protein, partial [Oscillospiraceae bacterium]|nr:S-layer homology domain-containing protein [Oscillospiraceae bacterium]